MTVGTSPQLNILNKCQYTQYTLCIWGLYGGLNDFWPMALEFRYLCILNIDYLATEFPSTNIRSVMWECFHDNISGARHYGTSITI